MTTDTRLIIIVIPLEPKNAISSFFGLQFKSFLLVYEAVKTTINDQVGWWGYMGRVFLTWRHLPFILRSTELSTFSMTNTIYRDLVCRVNGGIYRLSCGTPWRYDGKASCMSKQTVTLLYWFWRPVKTMNVHIISCKTLCLEYSTKHMN